VSQLREAAGHWSRVSVQRQTQKSHPVADRQAPRFEQELDRFLDSTSCRSGRNEIGEHRPLLLSLDGFPNWRNDVFGHGVFRQDRGFYAKQVHERLPVLQKLFDAFAPIFELWGLGATVNGVSRPLVGVGQLSLDDHTHVPDAGARDPVGMHSAAGSNLSFGALLALHRCEICGDRHIFFLDKLGYLKSTEQYQADLIEYALCHTSPLLECEEIDRLAKHLPTDFRWQRTAFDADEAVEGVRIAFRDFDTEYERPTRLLDRLWHAIDQLDTGGYVLLEGPSGVGKSFALRGLQREGEDREMPVLAYYVQPGSVTDYKVFVTLLADEAKRSLRFRTQEIQTSGGALGRLQGEFAEFAATLMRANQLASLIIAIDSIDELPDPNSPGASILDFLPPAEKLPDGCVVLLSSREERRPHVDTVLARLRQDAPNRFVTVPLTPEDAGQQATIRSYLQRMLPEPLRNGPLIERMIGSSDGGIVNLTESR
jgi:hypothetical protein